MSAKISAMILISFLLFQVRGFDSTDEPCYQNQSNESTDVTDESDTTFVTSIGSTTTARTTTITTTRNHSNNPRPVSDLFVLIIFFQKGMKKLY